MASSDIGVRNDVYRKLDERKDSKQSFTDVLWELVYKAEKIESRK